MDFANSLNAPPLSPEYAPVNKLAKMAFCGGL
jgi:hypothetical protein